MNAWLDALAAHALEGRACVVVTVAAVRGSAPRGVGTRMTVALADGGGEDGELRVDGTIGGGALEHAALERARELLAPSSTGRAAARGEPSFAGDGTPDAGLGTSVDAESKGDAEGRGDAEGEGDAGVGGVAGAPVSAGALAKSGEGSGVGTGVDTDAPVIVTERFPLGKALSQCCGGEVTLQFERHPGNDFRVEVFGAGHVAQELARLLVRLPCIATFHDERQAWLERLAAIDGGGRLRLDRPGVNLHACVEAGPANAYWLVMTHSHELDLEVVEAVLSRGDSRYCGLIASRSKAASFRGRLARKGFTDEEIGRLSAPLGQRVETGNTPMEVAIAAAADVLSARTAALSDRPRGRSSDQPPDGASDAPPSELSSALPGELPGELPVPGESPDGTRA